MYATEPGKPGKPDSARTPRVIVREARRGRGVFARRDLRAGEILLEYKGECLDETTALDRLGARPFLLGLGDGRIVDGDRWGNTARWIKHACEPNSAIVERKGRLFVRALRPIRMGREITLDHALSVNAPITETLRMRFACDCGSRFCRGTRLLVQHPDRAAAEPRSRALPAQPASPATIRVLERLPRNRIVVSWREPGRACYSEQLWLPAIAAVAGVCALTLASFEAGASVFLPSCEPRPLNVDERILADAIRALDIGPAAV
ncbi:SET domain-containing protein-lysine N-methyltransferase [Paraburkholderia acidisoli]|nr:SET domain-containing protein-lysine N-methyltransferase [Paraburkholderia acidisoli]